MAGNTSPHTLPRPHRKLGCLPKLIIWSLVIGFLYWLLFAPISETSPSNGGVSQPNAIDGELSSQQQAGYETLAAQSGKPPKVVARNGTVGFLSANVKVPDNVAVSPSDKALYFLEQNKNLFQIDNVHKNLRLQNINEDEWGDTYITYTQEFQGVQVYGSSITIGVNANGEVNLVNGGYLTNLVIDVMPTVRSRDAENTATTNYGKQDGTISTPTTLAIYSPSVWGEKVSDPPKLVWIVTVSSKVSPGSNSVRYVVDALSGNIIARINLRLNVGGIPYLAIYEANEGGRETATLVFHEQGTDIAEANTLSPSAEDAKKYVHQIHDYYWNTFGRINIDKIGNLLKIYVDVGDPNEGCPDISAGWNHGEIPEGDEFIVICSGFAQSLDPLAHEFSHGIVAYDAKLTSAQDEPGAVNEAYADLFAVFIDKDDPWKITSDNAVFRDLSNPSADGIPTSYDPNMTSCSPADQQFGCVHDKSIVFSHAAYLMHKRGISIEELQYIFYFSLSHGINNSSTLPRAAYVVHQTCEWLVSQSFPPKLSNKDCETVRDVFTSVGLMGTPSPQPSPLPPDILDTIQSWLSGIQQQIRDLVDQIIGDLRQRIEDAISNLLESIKQKIEEGIQNLLQELLNLLIDAINKFFIQLCGIPCLPAFIPIGAVILRFHRRKKL